MWDMWGVVTLVGLVLVTGGVLLLGMVADSNIETVWSSRAEQEKET